MVGYVARRRGRYDAVSYEELDPVTGRKRRTWHGAGCHRDDAEQLVARLAFDSQPSR